MKYFLLFVFTTMFKTGAVPDGNLKCCSKEYQSCPDHGVASYDICKDWQDNLNCYSKKVTNLVFVNCSWMSVPWASKSTNYIVYVDWPKRICQANTMNTFLKMDRNDLYTKMNATIFVSPSHSTEDRLRSKVISIIPEQIVKCDAPSDVVVHWSSHKLIFQWIQNSNAEEYQLRYREMSSRDWNFANETKKEIIVTIAESNLSSSFVAQLRCIPNAACFHCDWGQEIVVPHELTESPIIRNLSSKQTSAGRREVYVRWEMHEQHRQVDEYIVEIKRQSSQYKKKGFTCKKKSYIFKLKETHLYLNLSMGYFTINISASNKISKSPSTISVIPDATVTEQLKQINATVQEKNIFLTWSPLFRRPCFVIEWGTSSLDMNLMAVEEKRTNYTLEGPFEEMKRYMVMIHTYKQCNCHSFRKTETTFGKAYIYVVEGVPRTGPANITIQKITKHMAVVKWTEIPDEDCLGFLRGYRIYYTDTLRNKTLDITLNTSSYTSHLLTNLSEHTFYKVEIAGITQAGEGTLSLPRYFSTMESDENPFYKNVIAIAVCIVVISLGISTAIFTLVFKRMKIWFWTNIPNPEHSTAIKINERALLENGLKPTLKLLLQDQDPDAASIHVFEERNLRASLMLELLKQENDNTDWEASGSEIANVPETSIISPGVQDLTELPAAPVPTDYSTTEFFMHNIMQKAADNVPGANQIGMKINPNNELDNMGQQSMPIPHDYIRQSQVMILQHPEAGTTLEKQISVSSASQ
uniref:Interleukin-6 receptor subunit beta-like n=1 Tax=Geotrypetes seraphini TaxID=260995 RepID=A0A6P8QCY1_GEOSA|nr:interleukin-6 receptor subunit beta-like [Geotrypetes seraphini]